MYQFGAPALASTAKFSIADASAVAGAKQADFHCNIRLL
jgi:hypothetical protein